MVEATSSSVKSLRVRAVSVPMDPPHRTAGGVVSESPLVLTDLTTDDGVTWEALRLPYEGSLWYGLSLAPLSRVLMLGMRGHVFRSDDLGESWQAVETGSDQSLQAAARLQDGRLVAVGLGGTVLTSDDGGERFEPTARSDRTGLAAVAEAADGALLLCGERGVWRVPAARPAQESEP